MPTTTRRKTAQLRRLLRQECIAMPGAFNAATARLIERAGFDAVYVSGAGLANGAGGVPDTGLLSLEEVTQLAGYIAAAVNIPAIVDADTGFGGPKQVAETVRSLEAAGLAGLHLEDQTFPKRCGHVAGKSVVSIEEMNDRLAAAKSARRDRNFLLIARTDARASEGLDGAIARALRYLKTGADAIFPEALESPAEFRKFAKAMPRRVPLMANMTEFGRGPMLSVKQLAQMGYRMVIFPQTAFRVGMRAEEEALRSLKRHGSQKALLPRMQTRQELYDLLDYDPGSS
jgi:methylisocitrate lyase